MAAVFKSLVAFVIRSRAGALPLVCACGDTVLAPIRGDLSHDAGSNADADSCRDAGDAACLEQARCVEGVYDGFFVGSFRSSAVGVPGLITPISDDDHKVMMTFGLRLRGGEGWRRAVSTCIHLRDVGADGVALEENSRAEFLGEVDCASGELRGDARGFYTAPSLSALGEVQRFYYKGSGSATFEPETQSFVNGTLEMREPPVLAGEQPGGTGTWSARLLANEELPLDEECLDVPFPESMFR